MSGVPRACGVLRGCRLAAWCCALLACPGLAASLPVQPPRSSKLHGGPAATAAGTAATPLLDYVKLTDNFLILPEKKLMFCMIQKVACSNFEDMFRFARAKYDPENMELKYGRSSPAHFNLTVADLERMMLDPSWHKAVFLRDPLERFASAWASKCVRGQGDWDGIRVCPRQFNLTNITFKSAVLSVSNFDLRHGAAAAVGKFNPHFQAMSDFCGGLTKTMKYYNTVEVLKNDGTTRGKVDRMLQEVNMSVEEIPNFDELFPESNESSERFRVRSSDLPQTPEEVQEWENKHNVGTSSQLSTYYPMDEPWIADAIMQHYAVDYKNFKGYGITPPGDRTLDFVEARQRMRRDRRDYRLGRLGMRRDRRAATAAPRPTPRRDPLRAKRAPSRKPGRSPSVRLAASPS